MSVHQTCHDSMLCDAALTCDDCCDLGIAYRDGSGVTECKETSELYLMHAIAKDPTHIRSLYALGMLMYNSKTSDGYKAALRWFNEILVIHPNHITTLLIVADMYAKGLGVTSNIATAVEYINRTPKTTARFNNIGKLYYESNDFESALEQYIEAFNAGDRSALTLIKNCINNIINVKYDGPLTDATKSLIAGFDLSLVYPDGVPAILQLLQNTINITIDELFIHKLFIEKGKTVDDAVQYYYNRLAGIDEPLGDDDEPLPDAAETPPDAAEPTN